MKIEKAKLKDIEELSKLMKEEDLYENSLDKSVKISSIKDIKKDIKLSLKDRSIVFFIAKDGKNILGTISVSIDKRGKTRLGRMQDIIVKKEYCGKNIGKMLFRKAEEYFKKNNCDKIQSFVREKNMISQKFWKKMNFQFDKTNGYVITKKIR